MVQTVDMASAIRSAQVYGARVIESSTPLATMLVRETDLATPVATFDEAVGRRWQDRLNDPGSAQLQVFNDDPALSLVHDDDLVRFELDGWAAFCMLVETRDQQTIASGEESQQRTTISGRGHLAILETALVYPSRGLSSKPIEENRVFNWASLEYDDSAWGYASELVTWAGQASADSPVWDIPSWPDPNAWWIWDPSAASFNSPVGTCFFRRVFTTDSSVTALHIYVSMDDEGEVWFDGQQVIAGGENNAIYDVKLEVSPGQHVIGVEARNTLPSTHGSIIVAAYSLNAQGEPSTVVVHSDSSWRLLAYPPVRPGMTVGQVIRRVIDEAIWRGALPGIQLAFTATTDSDGVPWPPAPDISTKVGTDYLTFIVGELCATWIDVWMEPGAWRLWAWVKGGRGDPRPVTLHGPTDPYDPDSSNLAALSHKRSS